MKHEILDDNVQTSDDTIRRILTLAPLDGSSSTEPVEIELKADELTRHCWPATGKKMELSVPTEKSEDPAPTIPIEREDEPELVEK